MVDRVFTLFGQPLALPSILGLQNQGQLPREFSGLVQGNVDMGSLYIARTMQTENFSAVLAAGSPRFTPAFTVEAGEAWFLHNAGVIVEVPTTVVWSGCIGCGELAKLAPISPYVRLTAGAATEGHFLHTDVAGFWLRPGMQLGFVSYSAAATVGVTMYANISKFKSGF